MLKMLFTTLMVEKWTSKMKKMKRILVTGGAGFIGSNLCKKLLQDANNYVICLDNFYTGTFENVKDLLFYDNFIIIKKDICDTDLSDMIELKDIDEIFNCACPASPVHYQGEHAVDTTMTCVLGMKNVLDLATKYNAKVMQFSTSEVYGEPDCKTQKETYRGNVNCDGIRSCYDEGKRCAESLCFDYNRQYKTRVKVIRIFNTYGPNMRPDDGRVISNVIWQIINNQDITIYGDGKQTRSFCYIDDLIKGIMTVMNTDDSFTGPVNLGNPEEITILEAANTIKDLFQCNNKIVFKPLPKDDPTHRCPDISLANKLGYKPEYTLRMGLESTIAYFIKLYNK